ncbi:peptidylprolyl isomerase [Winogradskyella sp. A3E31]|uniref:peptidylprolyl isomerase n=1 Tax=Winogradskyella sp. A3E31 TaxID=3349637 RepID=UPI00398AA336
MKKILYSIFVFPLFLIAQTEIPLDTELDSISTSEDAKTFIKGNKNLKGKLLTFNKEKHKSRLAEALFKLSKGGKHIIKTDYKKTFYKIIDKAEVTHYRVSYIYFDGNKLTLDEINDKRTKILSQYNNGYKFEALAKLYSMDMNANRGGDLGWFIAGQMHPIFENAIKNHEINDVFTLDIKDRNWYYIILKTYDATPIEELTVLKVTEPIR